MNTLDLQITMEPIGWVESCYPDKFGTPRQPGLIPEAIGKIHIYARFQPQESLRGLSQFSHLWVLFSFHKNVTTRFHASVHPPRLNGESQGVFATRSPHRPNAIGMSVVKILSVESDGIQISGIDLIHGTPVLDIKPYLPEIESIPEAQSSWTQEIKADEPVIEWSPPARESLEEWQKQMSSVVLRDLIENTLRLDPRPIVYRGYEQQGKESPYRSIHAVRIHNGDIHFQFIEQKKILIHEIKVLQ